MGEPISMILHGINLILTLILFAIYFQNYRKMKSKYTIGLMLFAGVLFLHSLMGIYFDLTMVMFSTVQATQAALALEKRR